MTWRGATENTAHRPLPTTADCPLPTITHRPPPIAAIIADLVIGEGQLTLALTNWQPRIHPSVGHGL